VENNFKRLLKDWKISVMHGELSNCFACKLEVQEPWIKL